MEYNFREIEKKWQQYWSRNKTFKVDNVSEKPKFYVLDMFPYPSGAGLHVGHPLGYIASDIYSRYKRLNGFNVLHPMGYDAFGLPAEQYAIQTGQHPAITTEKNIARYREQLDKLGFSYDWDREVRTCDPFYYKWTQWTFIQLFNSWYNQQSDKAEPIENLIKEFSLNGNALIKAACTPVSEFTANEWNAMNEKQQQEILMHYRLAYLADTYVNWCPALGTVLANDEVKEGYSVRGNHPVERKTMKQWLLRITAYAERLLSGLETLEWSDSLKEIQRNWIGRSEGASIRFPVEGTDKEIEVFTTRPDTIFGSTFMVLAPEHELATEIAAPDNKKAVENYIHWAKNRSERERQAEVKKVSGEFTGAYAVNPLNGNKIPVWVAEYVLAGYGTGAIMAVPAHDSRDYAFAKHFSLPIVEVVSGGDISNEAYEAKDGILVNSGFINGMKVKEAISAVIQKVEEMKIGYGTINYRLRDAIFSRQRYWGEPFPVYYKDNIPYVINENQLPLELPEIDAYQPTETGEPPLARAKNWKTPEGYPFECSTMPGFAGSSGYYLRFMDTSNPNEYFSRQANEYWKQVDLYIGGAEHATGHLVYARFWNKFLFDRGYTCLDEPFKKLINQGMIQGRSNFVYRMNFEKYAEYLLWNQISGKKLGVEFFRDFRDGHRKFDFFSPQAKLVIEIKSIKKLEKLVHPYQEYFKEKDYRLMLIPIRSMIDTPELVIEKLKAAIAGEPFEMLTEIEAVDFPPTFVSKNIPGREHYTTALHVDIHLVDNDILDIEAFKNWMPEANNAEFMLEDGKYICGWEIEKMSKSLHNVQNPDELVEKYGADTLRMYEMFLGPLEQSKPWDTKGIEGVFRFIRKFWRLFHNNDNEFDVSESIPSETELKILHKTIKRVKEDIERFSFNTAVSTFMICTNELGDLKCNKRQVLEPLVILISPYAPHIAEEMWSKLGHSTSVANAIFPVADEKYLSENVFEYPVSFNGKMRFKLILPADMPEADIQSVVLSNENAQKWLEGKAPKKVIIVRNKIINVVV